jgi:hypothetical protein
MCNEPVVRFNDQRLENPLVNCLANWRLEIGIVVTLVNRKQYEPKEDQLDDSVEKGGRVLLVFLRLEER